MYRNGSRNGYCDRTVRIAGPVTNAEAGGLVQEPATRSASTALARLCLPKISSAQLGGLFSSGGGWLS